MLTKQDTEVLRPYLSASKGFFAELGGTIRGCRYTRRRNIEVVGKNSADLVLATSLDVEFGERRKFGSETYEDAYARYRQMRKDWWAALEKRGVSHWKDSMRVVGGFTPLLSPDSRDGTPYAREGAASWGCNLTRSDGRDQESDYYAKYRERFSIEWLLRDANGIVIGPDIGLLVAVAEAAAARRSPLAFWDIGSGTGELSSYLIKQDLARHVLANEASPALREHLQRRLGEAGPKVTVEFQFCPALDLVLPEQADVVAVGIYYGAQPPFFEKHGERLARALGADGVLLVQSGMIEGRFNHASVIGGDSRLCAWDWFPKTSALRERFGAVETVVVASEVLTIASASRARVAEVQALLREHWGAETVPALDPIDPELLS